MGRVSGKVAIVTGAAGGIGLAIARRMIEEGAKVMLTDLLDKEGEAAAKALGPNARFMHHDVVSEATWKQVVAATEEAFGPVSVLVNNAGIVVFSPIETTEESDFHHVVNVNQVAVFLGMKSVLPSMKRAGGGSIVNISSVAGLIGAPLGLSYCASKFAVRGMSKSAAVELAPYNIRVNSIHPGMINTTMTQSAPDDAQEVMQRMVMAAPAARRGEPNEVANVVLMLASDESHFSTGAEFAVDGGLSCKIPG